MGFHSAPRSGDVLIEAEDLAKAYDRPLFENLSFSLERGEPYFRNVWDEMAGQYGQPLLRQVAAAPTPLSFANPDPGRLKSLERMTRYRILAKTTDGYTVEVPLIRRWVNDRAPS